MSDENTIMEWSFKGLVGVILTIGGWLWVQLVKAVSKNRDDLADHKLHVADNYIKKDVVERIHDRIDDLAEKETVEKLSDEVSEIRTDIKSILRMVGGNGRT